MPQVIKRYNNVVSFHGSDHKTGVTMIAISVCLDICRRNPGRDIMFLGMNGRPSCEYVKEETCSIEDIKPHIDNRILAADEIKQMCYVRENLYMLGGIRNVMNERSFFPETSEYLLNTISESFDLLICDTGNDLDNGLAVGALHGSGQRYCVISQCESSVSEFEKLRWLFMKLGLDFNAVAVNKYFIKDPYDTVYLAERLCEEHESFMTVSMAGYGRQAEMDHQTLLEYRNDAYGRDIKALADRIMAFAGMKSQNERKKKLWLTGFI